MFDVLKALKPVCRHFNNIVSINYGAGTVKVGKTIFPKWEFFSFFSKSHCMEICFDVFFPQSVISSLRNFFRL